ncbi:MAG: FHA domain-containing protein [Solirubrobacterales bacterium]
MESLTSGTLAGTGSFRCEQCGYVVTLAATDALPGCPGCSGRDFTRASLFGAPRFTREVETEPDPVERAARLAEVRGELSEPGQYLAFDDSVPTHPSGMQAVAITREWTRIGRSLAADIRFDDPTVSRRHALVVRQPDGVRVLDDRSLNGVFVNGERVEWRTLADGDEIVVGRYRLYYLDVVSTPVSTAPEAAEA